MRSVAGYVEYIRASVFCPQSTTLNPARTRVRAPQAGQLDHGIGPRRSGLVRVNGRKRHILVDTGGLVLRAKVHTADIQDRAGVPLMFDGVDDQFPTLRHVWVDQGYTGSGRHWIEAQLWWTVEVVRHSPRRKVNGYPTVIGATGGRCGSHGNVCRRRPKSSAALLLGVAAFAGYVTSVELFPMLKAAPHCAPPHGPAPKRQPRDAARMRWVLKYFGHPNAAVTALLSHAPRRRQHDCKAGISRN